MAVDYLSTLNSGGSGLNITQLVDSIVDAEIEPAKAIINKQVAANDLAISEVAKFRVKAATLEGALSVAGASGVFQAKSSSTSVSVIASNVNLLSAGVTTIKTNQLATRQVLEFSGFSSIDADVAEGTLSISTGSWSADGVFSEDSDVTTQIITIDSPGASLSNFASRLNSLSGIEAQVVDKGDGTFSLSVMSDFGENNALRLSASPVGLADFDTTDGSNEISAATNAEILVNGITVSREKNTITDVVEGTTLILNSVTSSSVDVTVETNSTSVKAEIQALVDQINTMRTYLNEATSRGLNGGQGGALAGDASISAIKRELASITTSPLTGFGSDPIYLAELGVQTNQDGTLSIDELKLVNVLNTSPSKLDAIYNSLNSIELDDLDVNFSTFSTPPEGVQTFSYDAASDVATLSDEILSSRINDDGHREFYKLTGQFAGLVINVGDRSVVDGSFTSEVYVGISLVEKLSNYLEALTAARGEIATKESYFKSRSTEYQEKLDAAENKATVIEARELMKFAKMEQAVTQLKSTGDYITTIMDAWAKSD